jgi:hypothetical protein
MPAAFARVPHDLRRIAVLLRALEQEPAPRLVVFGNSVAMCGVDARVLRDELGAPAFRSSGQTLAESFLYYQEIPSATEVLVYVVLPEQLEAEEAFHPHVLNAFRMSGFEPAPDTLAALEAAYSPAAVAELRAPAAARRFEARWVLRQGIDAGVRQLLRPDLDLDRAASDLEFPAPYRERIPETRLASELRQQLDGRPPGPLRPVSGPTRLLQEIAERAARDGRRLVFVLPPTHPQLVAGWGEAFLPSARSAFRDFEARGIRVVDALDLLGEDEFIDAMHSTPRGAERLTRLIADAVRPD